MGHCSCREGESPNISNKGHWCIQSDLIPQSIILFKIFEMSLHLSRQWIFNEHQLTFPAYQKKKKNLTFLEIQLRASTYLTSMMFFLEASSRKIE